MYEPAFKHKKAPGRPGRIAWNDTTRQPHHLQYNGKQWEVRPIDATGRVTEGFTSGDPVKALDTLDDAWYYASSGGKHLAPEKVRIPVPPHLREHIDRIPARFKASRAAAEEIATSRNGAPTVERIGEGTPQDHILLTAERTIGKHRITVAQRYTEQDGRAVKQPPTVTIARDSTTIVHEHILHGEKHMAWFFTNDEDDILTWTGRAEKRLRSA